MTFYPGELVMGLAGLAVLLFILTRFRLIVSSFQDATGRRLVIRPLVVLAAMYALAYHVFVPHQPPLFTVVNLIVLGLAPIAWLLLWLYDSWLAGRAETGNTLGP